MSSLGSSLAGGVRFAASQARPWRGDIFGRHCGSRRRGEPAFITRARGILRGDSMGKDHWATRLRSTTSPAETHQILLELATATNSTAPVAARFQTRPRRVLELVPPDSIAGSVATSGILYRFHTRPRMINYPRPLRLNKPQMDAIETELERLAQIGAIEPAPSHDNHKALGPQAPLWERSPVPPGEWPREQAVPVLNLRQQAEYDLQQEILTAERRKQGLPYRDFESVIFTVPKSDGGFRLCQDYRQLNMFQKKSKFQLDGTKAIAQLIQPGDSGMLVDVKDCYIEFGLHPVHRRLCRFRDPRLRRWQWRTMSFGMSEAPHLCTRVLRPFIRILKGLGIRSSIYLDDLLLLSQSPTSLAVSMGVAIEMLQLELGLQLKLSKCNFSPSTRFTALGIVWDTRSMKCHVPPKRIANIKSIATRILNRAGAGARAGTFIRQESRPVRVRDLARLVGQCVSTSIAINEARRRLLFIQHLLGRSVSRKGWEGETLLTPEAVEAIRWWTSPAPSELNRHGNDIVPPHRPIQGKVDSDAASHNAGWGGTLTILGKKWTTRGFFTAEERELFINCLELLGHRKTVESLLPRAIPRESWHLVHLQCQLDNVSAIKYLSVAVSRSLQMSVLGADHFDWKQKSRLSLGYEFLPGVLNVESDGLSRWEMTHREWKLNRQLYLQLCRLLDLDPEMDLFASRQNTQCPLFFSYEHDYEAVGTNCFNANWTNLGVVYAYPPPILIARFLQKLRVDGTANAVLLAPVWPAQNWWPTMLEMITSIPLLLPNQSWITVDQWDQPTWPGKWSMIAVPLSGNLDSARASRRRYWSRDGPPKSRVIRQSMTRISGVSDIGGPTLNELVGSVRTAFELAT